MKSQLTKSHHHTINKIGEVIDAVLYYQKHVEACPTDNPVTTYLMLRTLQPTYLAGIIVVVSATS